MRVAGIGFRTGASFRSLQEVLTKVESIGGSVSAFATIEKKSGDPSLLALAQLHGVPIHAADVKGVATPTQSDRIMEMHSTGSVAEAAALVIAGPGSTITVQRISSADGMATAAIAEVLGEKK
ncbi:cobalamin biosynthesis protein [Thioclava sp. FR2]|uniref:cobalamin biosynthesis protein n=1 Tax=Thioclava sp. FR2 TaxID=3445780 RepID=UPI003EB9820A